MYRFSLKSSFMKISSEDDCTGKSLKEYIKKKRMIIKPYNIHLFFPLRSCILVFKVWFYFQCYRKEKQRIRLSFKLGVYADFDSVLFCHKAINAFMCSAFLLFCIVPFIICFIHMYQESLDMYHCTSS